MQVKCYCRQSDDSIIRPGRDAESQSVLFLPERRYASAGTSYGSVSVCLCLSQVGVTIETDERIELF